MYVFVVTQHCYIDQETHMDSVIRVCRTNVQAQEFVASQPVKEGYKDLSYTIDKMWVYNR